MTKLHCKIIELCFILLVTTIRIQSIVSSSLSFNEDDQCPPNLSGPDCTIPYEVCADGLRRCYNNSLCVKNKTPNPVTGEYGYSCDCSFAESVSVVAGHECEYSATEICSSPSTSGRGGGGDSPLPHFCTNGGACGTFVYRGQVHTGCHCPREYAGAHCQYLKALGGIDFVQGESKIEEVGSNFYAFSPKPRESNTFTWVTTGLTLFVIGVIAFAVLRGTAKARKWEQQRTSLGRNGDVSLPDGGGDASILAGGAHIGRQDIAPPTTTTQPRHDDDEDKTII